jgi:hypothetical protein
VKKTEGGELKANENDFVNAANSRLEEFKLE